MASRLVVLDESKQSRHRILSVGGIVIDLADLGELESDWATARLAAGLKAGQPIKYSMRWPEGSEQRRKLIGAIPALPVNGVISLLEDFRPLWMRAPGQPTRKDSYIQCRAFEYVLQRLAGDLYVPPGEPGPHLLMIDGRDDFKHFRETYQRGYEDGWPQLPHHPMPPLREKGFSSSLAECSNGPAHEIADLIVSCVSRWADERCMSHKGGKAPDLEELNECMVDLRDLFPPGQGGVPPRRRGHSIVVHAANRTGKEVLHANIDSWLRDLTPPFDLTASEEIPF